MSSARLGSSLMLKASDAEIYDPPSLSFSNTPLALSAEVKTSCPASIHLPVQIHIVKPTLMTPNWKSHRTEALQVVWLTSLPERAVGKALVVVISARV
jgi:hypothetical protein